MVFLIKLKGECVMAKYIAHNAIDENGRIKGGKAGDQTGKECCIRTMYFDRWDHVIRILNDKVRKQFGNNMIDIAKNNNVEDNSSTAIFISAAFSFKFPTKKLIISLLNFAMFFLCLATFVFSSSNNKR
jgi:hypothetical protein